MKLVNENSIVLIVKKIANSELGPSSIFIFRLRPRLCQKTARPQNIWKSIFIGKKIKKKKICTYLKRILLFQQSPCAKTLNFLFSGLKAGKNKFAAQGRTFFLSQGMRFVYLDITLMSPIVVSSKFPNNLLIAWKPESFSCNQSSCNVDQI